MENKESKPTKAAADSSDDFLLPELTSKKGLRCKTCNISFTDPKSYESHMSGKKHEKKVAEEKMMANKAASKKTESEREDPEVSSDDSSEISCEICNKSFTGYICYAGHLKGSGHAKNVKKQKLKQQLGNMPEVLETLKNENDSDEDNNLKPYARCSTCNKEFSGPEPFSSHMKSAVHHKKVKEIEALKKLREDEAENLDDEFYSTCDVCQKSFSGIKPFQIHMKSRVHQKALEKKKIAEEIKEFYAKENDGYVCKECKKTFTDPAAFKSHLQNNSHEKLRNKAALQEFLSAYPEIVFVAPIENEDSGDESDESDSKFYLICKVCEVSFSGPESAQEHVKSKRHISLKREKKARKLMRKQKKESSAKSDSKNSTNKNIELPPQNNSSIKTGNEDSTNAKSESTAMNGNEEDGFELLE